MIGIIPGRVINVVPRSYPDKKTKQEVKVIEIDLLQAGQRNLVRVTLPESIKIKPEDKFLAMCSIWPYSYNDQGGVSVKYLPEDPYNFEGPLETLSKLDKVKK